MQPTIEEVQEVCTKVGGGCVKLSPAIDLEDVEGIGKRREVEYIEDRSRVTQGLLWFDSLATSGGNVTATSPTTGETISGNTKIPEVSAEIGSVIFEPNPALERAKLHTTLGLEFCLWEPAFGLGLICGKEQIKSKWFTAFEVLETTQLRREKIVVALQKNNAGEVEVKTRGGVVNPDRWQKQLQKPACNSNERLTVFALRLEQRRVAIIARRIRE